MSDLRLRFAPSPTGYLHIGGARTALFSWLWARSQGGKFVLRIEDTDQERNSEASVQAILDSMTWLGLDWDEGPSEDGKSTIGDFGPYFQSQRLEIYRTHAEQLVRTGHAYRCYATKEEIDAAREAHRASGSKQGFRFQSPWRDRKDSPENADAPHAIRFRAPQTGATGWPDLVKGRIDVPNDAQQDFILLRANGMPLYNFACVVDDMTMKINVVARGDDHIVNTAPQVLIYEALGKEVPKFAHLPMILAPNGEKLSKRHAAVSMLEYRDMGYLPDAVLNYLARLGWSHGDQEIFSKAELKEKFTWDKVGKTAAKYDAKKFAYVQAEHLRACSAEVLAEKIAPALQAQGFAVSADNPQLIAAIPTVVTRATTLHELTEGLDLFFQDPPVFDPKAKEKFLVPDKTVHLHGLIHVLEGIDTFDEATLEGEVKGWLEAEEIKLKEVAQPARVALTGRTKSPGLFEVMVIFGKEKTLNRLRSGLEAAKENAEHSGPSS